MIYLSAAVVLVGAIGLLNLVLIFGVLRRLRETPPAAPASGHHDDGGGSGLVVGRSAEPFTVRLLHGGDLTEADLTGAGQTLVGFFTPGCGPCKTQAPKFAERAAAWPGGPDRVLAVIIDDSMDGAEFGEQFTGLARIILDGMEGPVATSLGVTAFPAFGILDDTATVLAESTAVPSLPELAAR
ncbi:MAG: redoxin domain-containing protein [Actinoplanes sp.]